MTRNTPNNSDDDFRAPKGTEVIYSGHKAFQVLNNKSDVFPHNECSAEQPFITSVMCYGGYNNFITSCHNMIDASG